MFSQGGVCRICWGFLFRQNSVVRSALHFPSADLLAMQRWTVEKKLCFRVPESLFPCRESAKAAQELVCEMARQRAIACLSDDADEEAEDSVYVLRHPHGFWESGVPMLHAARLLKEFDFIVRKSDMASLNSGESSWQLSHSGPLKLQVAYAAHSSKPVFSPPAEATEHCSVLDLILYLQQQGWACRVKTHGVGARSPYKLGEEKVWWVKENESSVMLYYLLSLATAENFLRAGDGIPHFKTVAFYKVLLGLQEPAADVAGNRSRAIRFDFVEGQEGAVPPAPKASARRRRVARGRVLDAERREAAEQLAEEEVLAQLQQDLAEMGAFEPSGSEPEADHVDGADLGAGVWTPELQRAVEESSLVAPDVLADREGVAAEPPAHASPASKPDSSASSSSGSSSTSSSGSSSSSSSGSSGEGEGDAAVPGREGHSTARLSTTFFWKSCRFTMLKQNGRHVGWEETCRHPRTRKARPCLCFSLCLGLGCACNACISPVS